MYVCMTTYCCNTTSIISTGLHRAQRRLILMAECLHLDPWVTLYFYWIITIRPFLQQTIFKKRDNVEQSDQGFSSLSIKTPTLLAFKGIKINKWASRHVYVGNKGEFWCIGKFHNLPEIRVGEMRGFQIANLKYKDLSIGTSFSKVLIEEWEWHKLLVSNSTQSKKAYSLSWQVVSIRKAAT